MPDKDIAQQRKEAEEKKNSPVQPADNMTTTEVVLGPSDAEKDVAKVYDSPISQLGLTIKDLEGRKAQAVQQDETAQRRSRNMQMIAGISDGLASLANLIGVGDRGTHIDMGPGTLTPLQQRFENARLERKADIKSIDDRLDQANDQLMKMKMAKGQAVAQAKQRANEAAKEQARFNIEMAFKKAEAERNAQNDYNLRLQQINQAAQQAGLKGNFPVLVGENEMLDIPKDKINEVTIGRIFAQLPQEYQNLAQGKPQYRFNEYGDRVFDGYSPATPEQKLAAIGAASRTDTAIQDELRKLAGTYKPQQKQEEKEDDEDFSMYKRTASFPISMNYRDSLPGGVEIPLRQ